ncbi:MAG: preprotein translocase subunit SecE [Candidatus Dormibacteria bacterium]
MDQDLGRGAREDRTESGEGGGYLREVWSELRKTVWPTWPELRQMTGVVIVTVVLLGAFLGVLDYGFTSALKPLYTTQPAATATGTPTPSASATPSPSASPTPSPSASASP